MKEELVVHATVFDGVFAWPTKKLISIAVYRLQRSVIPSSGWQKNLNIQLLKFRGCIWDLWTSRITWGLNTQVFYLVPVFSIPNNRWKLWPNPRKPKSENGGWWGRVWGASCARHGETNALLLARNFHSKLGIVTCDFHDSHVFHPQDLFEEWFFASITGRSREGAFSPWDLFDDGHGELRI